MKVGTAALKGGRKEPFIDVIPLFASVKMQLLAQ
jgi:hypothetical protein